MLALRSLLQFMVLASLCGPAISGPLDEAIEQCVLSDQPHAQRLETLQSAGWRPMDYAGATYAAHGTLFTGLTEAPFSNEAFWNDVERHFVASTKQVEIQKKFILAAKSGAMGSFANLQKDGAILRLYWRDEGTRQVTYCGYQQPERRDPRSYLPGNVLAPPYLREFSIGTVIETTLRKFGPDGAWVATTHQMHVEPDLEHLRTLSPEFPEIGYAFSTFVGVWE